MRSVRSGHGSKSSTTMCRLLVVIMMIGFGVNGSTSLAVARGVTGADQIGAENSAAALPDGITIVSYDCNPRDPRVVVRKQGSDAPPGSQVVMNVYGARGNNLSDFAIANRRGGYDLQTNAPIYVNQTVLNVVVSTSDGTSFYGPTPITFEACDGGLFNALPPARVLDTRVGNGAPKATVGPGASITVQLTGRGGLPVDGVGAVVLNTTVTNPTGSGYISVYPAGSSRPVVSNLNFVAGQSVPNAVTVPVGTGGRVAFYNGSSGTVDLVADVSGYFLSGTARITGAFAAVAPNRILDTRNGTGAPRAKVGAGATLSLLVSGRGGIPSAGVAAVVMNTTVTNPSGAGYLTVHPSGTARPVASSLNFVAGQTAPNSVTVPVGGDGRVSFYNGSSGTVDLLADISGYYLAGSTPTTGSFVSLAPARVLDTRNGTGAVKRSVARLDTVTTQLAGRGGLPATGVASVVLNATATNPTGSGYITAYPAGGTRPVVSSLNFVRGQTIPNAVTVPVSEDGKVSFYNGSSGTVDLVADVAGYYLSTVIFDR